MKKMFSSLILSLFLTGCHVPSQVALRGDGGRSAYNQEIKATGAEQMLLNLVRLRYCDTPYFLDVSSVTTQFTYGSQLSPVVTIPGFSKENPASIGGEFSWQNQPTIQYSPLEGKAFVTQLMRPIDLKIIQKLVLTGWDVNRVFRVTIQSLDDIPNAIHASGPTPEYIPTYKKFFEVTDLLRHLQLEGKLLLGVGFKGEDECKGHAPNTLQLRFPQSDPLSKKLAGLLEGSVTENGNYALNMVLGYDEEGEIGVMPRSVLGCMYYLSLGVHVPYRDIKQGVVSATRDEDGTLFDWSQMVGELLTVHCSYTRPKYAYIAVQYRNCWFYIADNDITSKRTFVLLQQIYNLQAEESKQPLPLLTIPLGVG